MKRRRAAQTAEAIQGVRMIPLISIIKDHIHSFQTAPFTADWASLINAAKRHEVSAILYAQCKDFIPEPFLADLKRYHSTVLYFYANRRKLTGRVEEALRGMEHFTIKGASIAEFYPCPAYRTMGDTDIVIHKEDRNEADRRLRGLGLKCVSSFDDREWQYYLHHMEFELHDRLVYNESVNTDAQEQYFNDCWKHVKDGKLDWEFHFMFLIFHLRKHFMNSGVGFRHFMDIAVLTFRGPKFDWSRIKEELVKIGLWPFTERIFALNQYWFGVPTPLPVSAFSDTFLSSATELILKNGVFGFDNENNAGNSAVNAIRDKNHSHSAMIKTAARKIFPAYETMIKVPQYSYLKGHPYLLPVAWMQRAVRSLVYKRVAKDMKTVIRGSFVDKETIQRREAIYEQWGV